MSSNKRPRTVKPVPWRRFVTAYESTTHLLASSEEDANPLENIRKGAWEAFPDAPHIAHDFALRFWALLDLVRREEIEQWVTRDDNGQPSQLHPALLLAASEVRMTKRSKFPSNRFRARVEEIISNEG